MSNDNEATTVALVTLGCACNDAEAEDAQSVNALVDDGGARPDDIVTATVSRNDRVDLTADVTRTSQ